MQDRHLWLVLFLGSEEGQYETDQVRAMKGLFLLSQSEGHPAADLYKFEPYDYGPFDSRVYRDLDALVADGLVAVSSHWGSNKKTYRLTDEGQSAFESLLSVVEPDVMTKVSQVKHRVTSLGFDELLSQIYRDYPDFATNSVARVARRLPATI